MNKKLHFWHFISSVVFIVAVAALTYAFRDQTITFTPISFIVLILATFRLTHLFVYDTVMDFIRDFFDKYDSSLSRSMSELIHCPWCTGTWMAFVVFFIYLITPYSYIFLIILALAGAGTLVEIAARFVWKRIPVNGNGKK